MCVLCKYPRQSDLAQRIRGSEELPLHYVLVRAPTEMVICFDERAGLRFRLRVHKEVDLRRLRFNKVHQDVFFTRVVKQQCPHGA